MWATCEDLTQLKQNALRDKYDAVPCNLNLQYLASAYTISNVLRRCSCQQLLYLRLM